MRATKLCLAILCAVVASTNAIVPPTVAAQTCAGDCNGDRSVTIDEIILGIRIALATAPIGDCRSLDADRNGAVTVNEVVAAVVQALQGCDGPVRATSTNTPRPTDTPPPTDTPRPTDTPIPPTNTPTPTNTPPPTRIDGAMLAASARLGTDPILRLFDLQTSITKSVDVAARARAAAGPPEGASGCQQLDCPIVGTQEICCSADQFSQFFDACSFHDERGEIVSLTGLYLLQSPAAGACTGAIPVGVSFEASLSSFTHDVSFPDGSFSRTFQELSESFAFESGGCTESQPDEFGFGIRGDGRRFMHGVMQQFRLDSAGTLLVDLQSDVRAFEITVSSTQEPYGCAVAAALDGSMTNADVRAGSEFTTDFTDFPVAQRFEAGALLLGLNGIVATDCLGEVTLSTVEPLRATRGDACLTSGRLEAQVAGGVVAATYTESGGVGLDFAADGIVDQDFPRCTDVPVDPCNTNAVGLCGACTALEQCQRGLACFPCSDECSGDIRRCALSAAFVTCEDGVF